MYVSLCNSMLVKKYACSVLLCAREGGAREREREREREATVRTLIGITLTSMMYHPSAITD